MIHGHGGNVYGLAKALGCPLDEIVDMSSNLNPLGSPPGLEAHLKSEIRSITRLPEVDAHSATAAVARRFGYEPDGILAGNGTTQFIYGIPKILNSRYALIIGPTYADYKDACALHGVKTDFLISEESRSFQPDVDHIAQKARRYDTVFICNPNNPTGTLIPVQDLDRLCRTCETTFFVVDESYLPFSREGQRNSIARSGLPNVIVLNSMSKVFNIPGLRIGFLIASREILQRFNPFQLPWAVNALAQSALLFLTDPVFPWNDFIQNTHIFLKTEQDHFLNRLAPSPLTVFPSTTSFMLLRLPPSKTAADLCDYLARHRILIRNCSNFKGLTSAFIRISLKSAKHNRRVADLLLEFL